MMTNTIGNFVADNIVFEVSKIGPVDPEVWAKKVVKITEKLYLEKYSNYIKGR